MKLSEIADRIAAVEPGRDVDAVHTFLRNSSVKALLDGEAGRGRTSAADYPEKEILRARILLACSDVGLRAGEMANVAFALRGTDALIPGIDTPPSAMNGGGALYLPGLDTIIRGIRAGETWEIQLRFTLSPEGVRHVRPWIRWTGWEDRSSWEMDWLHGETHLATVSIPASSLLEPLL